MHSVFIPDVSRVCAGYSILQLNLFAATLITAIREIPIIDTMVAIKILFLYGLK